MFHVAVVNYGRNLREQDVGGESRLCIGTASRMEMPGAPIE